MENSKMRCVISVLGADKSGVVAAVATLLAENDANIIDINQTILEGIFSMTMIVDLNTEVAGFNEVQLGLSKVAQEIEMQITVQREDVFKSMYTI